jgi:hypothetical protein
LEYAAAGLAQPALLRSVQNVTDVLRRIIEDANSVAIDGAQEYHDPIVQENAMVLSALHYVKITKLAAVGHPRLSQNRGSVLATGHHGVLGTS